jgi:hypothetical protein
MGVGWVGPPSNLATTQPFRTKGPGEPGPPALRGFGEAESEATVEPSRENVNVAQRHPLELGDRATRQWTVKGRLRWLLLSYTSNSRFCIVSTSSLGAR